MPAFFQRNPPRPLSAAPRADVAADENQLVVCHDNEAGMSPFLFADPASSW